MTAFGPQGPNFSTVRPATAAQASGGADTWCVDCSAAGALDGTILDASFFNMFIANLRVAVNTAGVPLDESDTMLYDAITAIAVSNLPTAGAGISIVANVVSVDVPSLVAIIP